MNYHFISGSSRGLGLAIAKALLARSENNHVTGMARSTGPAHSRYEHWQVDLGNAAALEQVSFPELSAPARIVLINNAGTLGEIERVGKLSTASIIQAGIVNMIAGSVLINAFMRAYQDVQATKLIINISSGAATKAYDGWGTYCSAKAAMEMLVQVADVEQSLDQPTSPFILKSVSPGPVRTDMQAQIRKASSNAFSQVDRFRSLAMDNKLPSPAQVAEQYLSIIEHPDQFPDVIHRL